MRDVERLLKLAQRAGATVRRTKSGHWIIRGRSGKSTVVVGGTLSDWRALRNVTAELRKIGVDL